MGVAPPRPGPQNVPARAAIGGTALLGPLDDGGSPNLAAIKELIREKSVLDSSISFPPRLFSFWFPAAALNAHPATQGGSPPVTLPPRADKVQPWVECVPSKLSFVGPHASAAPALPRAARASALTSLAISSSKRSAWRLARREAREAVSLPLSSLPLSWTH